MAPRLELAQLLLRKASDDLAMARRLSGDATSPQWGIAFHVQQAVEKSLKAVLCSHDIEYPRTHNIAVLLDLLPEDSQPVAVAREALVILTPYGVIFRYDEMGPTDAELAHLPERASLIGTAEAVVNWAEAIIVR